MKYSDDIFMAQAWFQDRTFDSAALDSCEVVKTKAERDVSVSVIVPVRNESATIRQVAERLKSCGKLIDEIIVIDSGSEDETYKIASQICGVSAFRGENIRSDVGPVLGKGDALWRGMHVANGDIIIFVDADIVDIPLDFILGAIWALLTDQSLRIVKPGYTRPFNINSAVLPQGGGRVTELIARPMINMFYPQLSGLIQPLAGETAMWRKDLRDLPIMCGYSIEIGLLIDCLDRFGLWSFSQIICGARSNRHQSLSSLGLMSAEIMAFIAERLDLPNRATHLRSDEPGGCGFWFSRPEFDVMEEGAWCFSKKRIVIAQRPPSKFSQLTDIVSP